MVFYVASTKNRLFARGIDDLFHFILFLPLVYFYFDQVQESGSAEVTLSHFLIFFGSRFLIEVFSLYFFGTSLGKYLFQLQVQSTATSDQKLSFAQCLLRCTAFQLSFFMSWAPFILALSRYDRTHLVDWIAQTKVAQLGPKSRTNKFNKTLVYLLFFFLTFQGIQEAFTKLNCFDFKANRFVLKFGDGD